MKSEKTYRLLGRLASIISVLMYVSYVAQIISNLHGNKGNPVQPAVAALNAFLWVLYGWYAAKKDWPIIVANAPGIVLGLLTAITCL